MSLSLLLPSMLILTKSISINAQEDTTYETEHDRLDCDIKPDEYVKRFEVKIYLCTRIHEGWTLVSDPSTNQENLELGGFDPRRRITILVHGFSENLKTKWLNKMKNRLLKRESMNVLLIDWSALWAPKSSKEYLKAILHSLNYRGAVISTSHVALGITRFLRNASEIYKVPLSKWNKIHFIGNSLGAHIAGQASRKLKEDVQVHRITGLDPANPCFESKKSQLRLTPSDAKIVDVIHTNSEPDNNVNFGVYHPLGTIDFYPNGGNNQPGCPVMRKAKKVSTKNQKRDVHQISAKFLNEFQKHLFKSSVNFQDVIHKILVEGSSISCNHGKAVDYFMKSLMKNSGKKMLATPIDLNNFSVDGKIRCQNRNCTREDNCVAMGMDAEFYEDARGTYYIDMTNHRLDCKTIL
ncbi:hypothetical protein QAD02_006253 [Eretmocerus hayati]|uniref:Uncharacterized protein n=1 Tax=Eretmocerus hayati TaxID=131215 RepID=A0ACC2N182_9HYME|nr:hypothetical protein QAD02_006253 [Eretmocerus hayati]